MPEPFKNLFNVGVIEGIGRHLARAAEEVGAASFDETGFLAFASDGLDALELKERSTQIAAALEAHLPEDFEVAAAVLRASLHPVEDSEISDMVLDGEGIRGWGIMPMTQFVAARGLEHFDLSMELLAEMTKRSSSELAIRTFIIADSERALATLKVWAEDENHHVRRLVSEGSRPRLPWAMRLNGFVDDPSPVLELLDMLRDDPSEYVRRSVANNLNDIAKDHPDLVAKVARDWLKGASKERERLVRHACRTLVKQGHPAVLKALGYGPASVALRSLRILTPVVHLGDALEFEVSMESEAGEPQNLLIDYVIHHRKANGTTSPKVFKWKTTVLRAGKAHEAKRRHAIRPITTRRYYPGTHFLELQVNGETMGRESFELET